MICFISPFVFFIFFFLLSTFRSFAIFYNLFHSYFFFSSFFFLRFFLFVLTEDYLSEQASAPPSPQNRSPSESAKEDSDQPGPLHSKNKKKGMNSKRGSEAELRGEHKSGDHSRHSSRSESHRDSYKNDHVITEEELRSKPRTASASTDSLMRALVAESSRAAEESSGSTSPSPSNAVTPPLSSPSPRPAASQPSTKRPVFVRRGGAEERETKAAEEFIPPPLMKKSSVKSHSGEFSLDRRASEAVDRSLYVVEEDDDRGDGSPKRRHTLNSPAKKELQRLQEIYKKFKATDTHSTETGGKAEKAEKGGKVSEQPRTIAEQVQIDLETSTLTSLRSLMGTILMTVYEQKSEIESLHQKIDTLSKILMG